MPSADRSAAQPVKAVFKHPSDPSQDFVFTLNPSKVVRRRAPAYADIPIAYANAGTFDGVPMFEWVRNKPEEIHVEFMLHGSQTQDVTSDVSDQLEQLDKLMEKDSRTGEPVDLIFKFGSRSDIVRIVDKEVEERIWNSDLAVFQAMVKLSLRVVTPRIPG